MKFGEMALEVQRRGFIRCNTLHNILYFVGRKYFDLKILHFSEQFYIKLTLDMLYSYHMNHNLLAHPNSWGHLKVTLEVNVQRKKQQKGSSQYCYVVHCIHPCCCPKKVHVTSALLWDLRCRWGMSYFHRGFTKRHIYI